MSIDRKSLAACEKEDNDLDAHPVPLPQTLDKTPGELLRELIEDMLDHSEFGTEWEKGFLESIHSWLKKAPWNTLSDKQMVIFIKLKAEWLERME